MDDRALMGLFDSLSREIGGLRQDVKDGFGEVNRPLERIDATLVHHGKQLAGGARAIAGLNEWAGKSDTDYARVLTGPTELKRRVAKLEPQQ